MRAAARFPGPMALLTVLLVSACSEKPSSAGGQRTQAAPPEQASAPVPMHDDTLAARVESDLKESGTESPDQVKARLPEHRAHLTALLENCREMMQRMKMTPPGKWTRLDQALREDLDRMGRMSPQELAQLLPEHRERVDQVLKMRRDMMRETM